jgi:hypothetical protein
MGKHSFFPIGRIKLFVEQRGNADTWGRLPSPDIPHSRLSRKKRTGVSRSSSPGEIETAHAHHGRQRDNQLYYQYPNQRSRPC